MHGCDIAVAATKEEVEMVVVEEQVANTLPCRARDFMRRKKLIPEGLFLFCFVRLKHHAENPQSRSGACPWCGQEEPEPSWKFHLPALVLSLSSVMLPSSLTNLTRIPRGFTLKQHSKIFALKTELREEFIVAVFQPTA